MFFFIVFILLLGGFFIFLSASRGLASRTEGAEFLGVMIKQFSFLILGVIGMFVVGSVKYKYLRPAAFWLFLSSIILNLLVFVPHIGLAMKGAHRWLALGPLTFQPSELLKFGMVMYMATWFASLREGEVGSLKKGLLPFILILGVVGILLALEPDTGTLMVSVSTAIAIFWSAGAKLKHLGLVILIGILAVGALAIIKPHVRDRLITYINPAHDAQGSSYQINQSLIAIGSGGIMGKGYGQSVQKFGFLPEPMGDSIFAVTSEEFGLIGAGALILLIVFFTLAGLKIALRLPDTFGRLMVLGLVILITSQSFINIAAMLGVIPLTGVPLLFVSQGGSALLVALLEVGVILNASKYQKIT